MENNTPEEILNALKSASAPICIIDSRFDFDAFGSAVSMRTILKENFDVDLRLVWVYKIPSKALNMLDTSMIEENFKCSEEDLSKHDLILALDSGDKKHILGREIIEVPKTATLVNIDHHPSNDFYGDYNYVDAKAVSACSVLFELFSSWEVSISTEIAYLLMLGILTDSVNFSIPTTKAKDLRDVATLMEKGGDMQKIFQSLYFNEPIENYRLRAIVYSNLKVHESGKFAYSQVLKSDMEQYGVESLDGLQPPADLIKRLDGVDFVFVVKEKRPGELKASLRSHNMDFNVAAIAESLGGGGHKTAASTGVLENISSVEDAVKLIATHI